MFSRLFSAALCSPAGNGLTSWLLFVMFNCVFVTFPCGILGQVWYLIVSIPDLYRLSYFQEPLSLNAGQIYCRMLQEEHFAILLTSLIYRLPLRSLLCILLSGSLTQVLL